MVASRSNLAAAWADLSYLRYYLLIGLHPAAHVVGNSGQLTVIRCKSSVKLQ